MNKTAKRIDGQKVAAEILQEQKQAVIELSKADVQPCLAVVLVGNNPASRVYVGSKVRTCEEIGMKSIKIEVAADSSEEQLFSLIDELNANAEVHGILVQFPLPGHFSQDAVVERIDPLKDVDGLHPINVGKLCAGIDCLTPCTPTGIPELIVRSGFEIVGKHVVVIGRSQLVGKPLMNLLVQKNDFANCTVTCCHSGTEHLANHTRNADIIVAAIGVPEFVTVGMVREGAIVIDVGINRVEDPEHSRGYRLVGDVKFDEVEQIASAITPVPGGVGPMTVAMLMRNTVKAAKMQCLTQSN